MKILLFFLMFIFNIMNVDSNSHINTIYDYSDLYSKKQYNIYFVNSDSYLKEYLDELNIEVFSYIKDGKKYYEEILEFDGISCFCSVSELLNIKYEYPFY